MLFKMKKIPYITFLLILFSLAIQAQDVNATAMGIPTVADVAGITGETAANIGNIVYNNADNLVYRYNGTNWVVLQNAAEVPLLTDRDVNNDPSIAPGTASPVPALETSVEEVVEAITPITSKAGRVFFPPSIEIDASTNTSGPDEVLNLYDLYIEQYTLTPTVTVPPIVTAISDGAPATIPVYAANELYYYVTYADPAVFSNIAITNLGEMTYRIVGQPTDDNTIINVVFVIK